MNAEKMHALQGKSMIIGVIGGILKSACEAIVLLLDAIKLATRIVRWKRRIGIRINKIWDWEYIVFVEVENVSDEDLGKCIVQVRFVSRSVGQLLVDKGLWATTIKPYEEVQFPKPSGLKESINHFIIPLCDNSKYLNEALSSWIDKPYLRSQFVNSLLARYSIIFNSIPNNDEVTAYARVVLLKREGTFGPLYKSKWTKLFTAKVENTSFKVIRYHINVEFMT